jgi:hypothetical protein
MNDGEIKVIDCPAKDMWADVLMKPLQGMAFRLPSTSLQGMAFKTIRMELMKCPVNYKESVEPDPERSQIWPSNTK